MLSVIPRGRYDVKGGIDRPGARKKLLVGFAGIDDALELRVR